MSEARVPCQKCKKLASFNALIKEADMWICDACYERIHYYPDVALTLAGHTTLQKQAPSSPPAHSVTSSSASLSSSDVPHSYACGNCAYKFTSDSFDPEKMCPYCGERGMIHSA